DSGIFDDDRYFDVLVEYAKASPDDVLIRISATNRGPDAAPLDLLPTLWCRNYWSWGRESGRPLLSAVPAPGARQRANGTGQQVVRVEHSHLGEYWWACQGAPALLFSENETNAERLWDLPNTSPHVKDAVEAAVIRGDERASNPAAVGTKVA